MEIKGNLYLIPTENNEVGIIGRKDGNLSLFNPDLSDHTGIIYNELYITILEPSNESHWCYDMNITTYPIVKCKISNAMQLKIAATTNPILNNLGVPKISLNFASYFVKKQGNILWVKLAAHMIDNQKRFLLYPNDYIVIK